MTRISKALLESGLVLLGGLAVIGVLMFAFAQGAQAHKAGAKSAGSALEVMMSDNGRTIVRGAEVTDISGDIIRARTEWGASSISWTIVTDANTAFVTKAGANTDKDDIAVGDIVSFSGELDDGDTAFSIDADAVKNWSVDDGRADRDTKDRDVQVKASSEAKGHFSDWRNMPILNWFKGNR